MKVMRFFWRYPGGPSTSPGRIGLMVLGLITVLFYFTRRMLVALQVGGWNQDVDRPVYQWAAEHQVPALQVLAVLMYWWGSTPGMTTTMLVLTLWLCRARRTWWPLATVAFTALGSVLATIVLKRVLQHMRPMGLDPDFPAPASYSFPSGHTLNAAALIGIITYLAIVYGLHRWRWWLSGIAGIYVLAMGASRIYLGHHWVSDVVVGLGIGAGWAAVVAILHFYFVPRPAPFRGAGRGRASSR